MCAARKSERHCDEWTASGGDAALKSYTRSGRGKLRVNDPAPHESGKIMICGHTPQRSGLPRNIGHAICLDTWAHAGAWPTCLDISSGRYWQANQQRQTRAGFLELDA